MRLPGGQTRARPAGRVALVPAGTGAVAVGLVVLGVASYVYLAVAGRALGPAGTSSVAVAWAIAYGLGPGLFFPVEQEVTRLVAGRRARGEDGGPVLQRGAVLAGALLATLGVIMAAVREPLAGRLFDGDVTMVWALLAAFAGMALAHLVRGMLAGAGRFGWYGAQLGLDGALRMVLAVVLGGLRVDSPVPFCLVLAAAPILSTLCTVAPILGPSTRRAPVAGSEVGWPDLCRGLGLLIVSVLLAQVVLNLPVINVRLLAPGDPEVAAAMLAALILVRVPLFLFGSVQASLLSGLSVAVNIGDLAAYRHLIVRTLAAVSALGAAGAVVAVVAGPWLATHLFDSPDGLDAGDFGWLAVGSLAYLWALVLGQGLLALDRHRDQALGWVVGTLALIAATLLPGDVVARSERGYAVGTIIVAVTLSAMLVRAPAALDGRPWSR
jgi:O-antigen/teichoic acid export membrane protein